MIKRGVSYKRGGEEHDEEKKGEIPPSRDSRIAKAPFVKIINILSSKSISGIQNIIICDKIVHWTKIEGCIKW